MSVQKLSIQLQPSMRNESGKILYVNFALKSLSLEVQYQLKKSIESYHINMDLQKYSSEVWPRSVNTNPYQPSPS